jgi:hypothetical protein
MKPTLFKFIVAAAAAGAVCIGILQTRTRVNAVTPGDAAWLVTVAPDNAFGFRIAKDGQLFGQADIIGWGPNWGWTSTQQAGMANGNVLDATLPFLKTDSDPGMQVHERVLQSGPNAVRFEYTLTAAKDTPLTQLSNAIAFNGVNGAITITHSDGKTEELPLPTALRGEIMQDIAKATFKPKGIGEFTAAFEPPLTAHVENNNLRMRLAYDSFPAGTKDMAMTLTFPDKARLVVSKADMDGLTKSMADGTWFAWTPANDVGKSEIGMESWLDKPAGVHGAVSSVGNHFAFADGTPVKFWGTNLANNNVAPEHAQSDLTAARFAKYGVNCVRMHKYLNPGWEGIGSEQTSTAFEPKGLEKLDYFAAQLKKHGVYYGWSHSYHYKVREGDAGSLLNYKEIASAMGGDTYGLINGAPDIQNRMIAMVVALLKHKNPYTGLTYAADPALAFLEVQNEDNILFWSFDGAMTKCPTYKEAMRKRFGTWLVKKYGTQAALAKAWGGALKPGEKASGSVDVQTNPWFFTDDGLKQQDGNPGAKRRLLDNALFFHDEQLDYYNRFVKAVRAAGYKGTINGSPWWSPTTLPQYLTLHADALTGYVDRHNYFEGGGDKIFASMLGDPGSGYFNTGLLQVADRPFSLSEWCHVYPNALSAESPAIMATYALGLQGWDASYEFQSSSTNGGFQPDAGHFPWGVWSADVPTQIGQFPSLTRMLFRGDVAEGAPIAVKRVSRSQLESGKFDFSDMAVVSGDIKSFTGNVPQAALAAGKTVVQFVPKPTPSTFPNMSKYASGKVITSTTKQLVWDASGKGYFKVMTPGTVGVVGFAQDKTVASGPVRVTLKSPYASVYVTAMDRKATLANCRKALVTVVGKECNTGFKYFTLGNTVVDNGQPPILVEGIKADVAVLKRPVAAVNVLDQDGRAQPGKTISVGSDGSFTIDTGRDKTIYYEIVFE